MSQPVRALAPLPFELVYDDGEPLDSPWHRDQMILALDLIPQAMEEQGRTDFYVGGNNFVYYSVEQAREVAQEEEHGGRKRAFRGPDVFWVGGVDPTPRREAWVAWEEDGRLPDFILELLSPKTAKNDRTVKKDLYARVFGTPEYFLYDPRRRTLEGSAWRHRGSIGPWSPTPRAGSGASSSAFFSASGTVSGTGARRIGSACSVPTAASYRQERKPSASKKKPSAR